MIRRVLANGFLWLEARLDLLFGARWNPLYQLGPLGFFYYWIVAVSGIYLYIFFDTGTTAAYESVERLTHDQWYLGGVMRSLHRYASDGMVLMMGVHILREYALGHLKGPRWFTWTTGIPIAGLIVVAGISGYWLVWDRLAQYVAIESMEWLDWLGIFGEPIARNFAAPNTLDDRFFTLLVFIHIVVPLLLLLVLWIHLQRVTRPAINPNRSLALGTFAMLVVLSLIKPAVSHEAADLATVVGELKLDWFYLAAYPLMDVLSDGGVWALALTVTVVLAALPLLPPRWKAPPAVVHLESCNGCERCADDCPYSAILMRPRSDGLPFEREAVVDPSLCVACGLCVGACPTATPFRRRSALLPGIELPDQTLSGLRDELEAAAAGLTTGPRVIVFSCRHGAKAAALAGESVATLTQPCTASLPPSFIDYALSRGLADGVLLAGCSEGACEYRFGALWTEARVAGRRDPYLRPRVPRERLRLVAASPCETGRLAAALKDFKVDLARLAENKTREVAPARPVAAPQTAAPQTAGPRAAEEVGDA